MTHAPVIHDVRILDPDEFRAAHALFGATIHRGPATDERWATVGRELPPDRTLGAHDAPGTGGAALVGTARSYPSRTVVPGGAVLGMAAVTGVGVRADRTRRGLLTALMRAQLDDVAGRGEPLASLRASETAIYGRFGYGIATRGRGLRIRADRRGWRPAAPAGGSVRLLARDETVPVLRDLHARIALHRTGGITRPDGLWVHLQRRLDERDHLLAAVHTRAGGEDDGFAVASVSGGGDFAERTLDVEDLHAADVDATAGLWRFLLDVDLVTSVRASMRPLDEPLELLLADPRACAVTGHEDETWLRLVDVPAALAARSFGAADPVLIAVHDPLLERNAGVYRIADGAAEPVGPLGGPVGPELECDVAALAMAYLGDRTPSELAATGWWRVHDAAAVARADTLFRTAAPPWCGTYF